jgi:hypothetical protein
MAETAETDIRHVGLRISLAQGGKSANGDRGDRLAHYNIKRKQDTPVSVQPSHPSKLCKSNQMQHRDQVTALSC